MSHSRERPCHTGWRVLRLQGGRVSGNRSIISDATPFESSHATEPATTLSLGLPAHASYLDNQDRPLNAGPGQQCGRNEDTSATESAHRTLTAASETAFNGVEDAQPSPLAQRECTNPAHSSESGNPSMTNPANESTCHATQATLPQLPPPSAEPSAEKAKPSRRRRRRAEPADPAAAAAAVAVAAAAAAKAASAAAEKSAAGATGSAQPLGSVPSLPPAECAVGGVTLWPSRRRRGVGRPATAEAGSSDAMWEQVDILEDMQKEGAGPRDRGSEGARDGETFYSRSKSGSGFGGKRGGGIRKGRGRGRDGEWGRRGGDGSGGRAGDVQD
jgi:hypothetical protein